MPEKCDSPAGTCAGSAPHAWYASGAGAGLAAQERAHVGRVLPDLFGYHIVQMGSAALTGLLEASRIVHKIVLHAPAADEPGGGADLVSAPDSLPFASDSIDVVVMPHVLEFTGSPHRVLREVERVLIGEGHLVLLGFNPWSLWGIWRLVLRWRGERPWRGHYYALPRLRDWLSLLDFELLRIERLSFRPPIGNPAIMRRLEILELLGRHVWPVFAGVYLVVARKRVAPLTPSRLRWRARRGMITAGIAEPSAREFLSE